MKNLLAGLIVFIFEIGTIFAIASTHINIADWFYYIVYGLMAILYFYFGYKTYSKENYRLAGIIFYLLALINILFINLMHANIYG